MFNFFTTIAILIFLVTQKILLLNEESLILLCFIVFVNLSINKLGDSFKLSLKIQSKETKLTLVESLNKLLVLLKKFTVLSLNFKKKLKCFFEIKNYYKNWIRILSNYSLIYNKYNLTLFYNKKFFFLNKIEEQTLKLLITIIIKKLNSIIKTKNFYVNHIKVNLLICTNTISVRECIQLIKFRRI